MDDVLADTDWPLNIDSARPEVWEVHAGDEVTYRSDLHPTKERGGVLFCPFVVHFDPYTRPSWIEPIQSFVLHWEAWPEHARDGDVTWYEEDDDSMPREIARWRRETYEERITTGRLEVRRDCLLAFMAAYELDLAVYSDHRAQPVELPEDWRDEGRGALRAWRSWASPLSDRTAIAVLRDVCILRRPPKESVAQPGDGEDRAGVRYPIGMDPATGRPIVATHPPTPFLTPVFFRQQVLERYLENPRVHSVEDSLVRGGRRWSLPIARTGRGTVHAWLGDVASLPRTVQEHWQAHAVVDDGGVPEWRIRTDFLAEFAVVPAEGSIARLKAAIISANAVATARFGEPLYQDVDRAHAESIDVLRIPPNPSMPAFAEQTRALALLVVDHLNPRFFTSAEAPEAEGSLNRLALLIAALTGRPEQDSKDLIRGLYAVQAIRSTVVAHRTGPKGAEALKKAGIGEHELQAGFARLAEGAATSIENLTRALK